MKRPLVITIIVVLVLLVVVGIVRFGMGGDEDTWICEDGVWVQHGNPTAAKPTTGCEKVNAAATETTMGVRPYNWSTMNEGPYRDQVSYATSDDLLHWTDSGTTLATHASVPGAVFKSGEIFLYFVDVSTDGMVEQIGLRRSTDNGATWSEKEIVSFSGAGSHVPVDPAPYLLDDGRIRLYYIDIEEAGGPMNNPDENAVYSAVSDDGLTFTQESGARFTYRGIFDPDVIKVGDVWRLAVGTMAGDQVLLATSLDGLTFTYKGVAYTGSAIPDLVFAFDAYFLFTGGIDIASSTDGSVFIPTGSRFQTAVGGVTADPSVVTLDDGTYMLFYKTII